MNKLDKSYAISRARDHLSDPVYQPTLVAYMLYDYADEHLKDLAWILGHDDNCTKNDVIGLIELMEKDEQR